jgi:hypothetical protein
MAALWIIKFVCLIINLTSKFGKTDIKLTISWTIERNYESPLCLCELLNQQLWIIFKLNSQSSLYIASFMAKSKVHASLAKLIL